MEHIVNVHIQKLPEGVYLATSDDVPGLVAQGRTITETLEIAGAQCVLALGNDVSRTMYLRHSDPVP